MARDGTEEEGSQPSTELTTLKDEITSLRDHLLRASKPKTRGA